MHSTLQFFYSGTSFKILRYHLQILAVWTQTTNLIVYRVPTHKRKQNDSILHRYHSHSRETYEVTNAIDVVINQWKSTCCFNGKPDSRRQLQVFEELNIAGDIARSQCNSYWRCIQHWNIQSNHRIYSSIHDNQHVPPAKENITWLPNVTYNIQLLVIIHFNQPIFKVKLPRMGMMVKVLSNQQYRLYANIK